MNRRNFLVTAAAACAATVVKAEVRPAPPPNLLDRPTIPMDEVREIAKAICAEFDGFDKEVTDSCKFWQQDGRSNHTGRFLDGVWTGLNFPRAEMVRNIVPWVDQMCHWDDPKEIIAWRMSLGAGQIKVDNSYDSWGYGLWYSASKILSTQPLGVRMTHVLQHAKRMGHADVPDFINSCAARRVEYAKKYNEGSQIFFRMEGRAPKALRHFRCKVLDPRSSTDRVSPS